MMDLDRDNKSGSPRIHTYGDELGVGREKRKEERRSRVFPLFDRADSAPQMCRCKKT